MQFFFLNIFLPLTSYTYVTRLTYPFLLTRYYIIKETYTETIEVDQPSSVH